MSFKVYEGIVEQGQILLKTGIILPENKKVYVIVPDVKMDKKKVIQILSPRLVRRRDAARFKMTVTKEKPHAK